MENDVKKTIASSTVLIMILTIIGYAIGFLTQVLIAKYFGTGKELDTFVAASIIPEFIFGLTNAIFLTSFVVIFPEYIKKNGEAEGKLFVRQVWDVLFCILCLIVFFLLLFAPLIAKGIAPGFSEEQHVQTGTMIRILSLAVLFFGMSSVTTGILYHEHKFVALQILRIILGLGIILGLLFFVKYVGAMSLAIGTVIGITIAFLIQYNTIKKKQYSFSFLSLKEVKKRIKDPYVQELLFLSWPLLVSTFLYYLTKSVVNMLASTQGEGSVSILNYAFLVVALPVIFFSGSIATSIFPHMAKQSAQQQNEELKKFCTKALQILLIIFIPLTCIFMLFSTEIIQLLFERGEFTPATTKAVASAVVFFAIGLIPTAIWNILVNIFYTKKQMKRQLGLYILLFLATIFGSLFFIPFLSYNGIALAWSLAYWIAAMIAFWYSTKNLQCIEISNLKISCFKVIFAAGIMSLILFFFKKLNILISAPYHESPLFQGLFLILVLGIAGIIYLFLLKLLGESEEITLMFSLLKQPQEKMADEVLVYGDKK